MKNIINRALAAEKKLFTLLFAVASSVGTMFAWVYESVRIGDLYYNLNDISQTAEVTYRKYDEDRNVTTANIPANVTYNSVSYSVTSIGEIAFSSTGLTSVTIPNSVTSIGWKAFEQCTGLTSVTIGNSVTSIGESAFAGCTSLTSIKIPNSVKSIGRWAFSRCSGLTSVTIGNSVSSIGEWAFANCSRLTSVTCFATRPPQLDILVFSEVDKSIPLYVPAGSISAYKSANQWKDFTNILPISETLTAYGTCGAQGDNLTWELSCDSILTISGTGEMKNYSNVPSVPWYSYKSSIQYVVIGNSVTSIGDGAFSSCSRLISVTIPNSVTSIGKEAFRNCRGLTSVTIPNSVTSIGDEAFFYCSGLTSMTIPNSVTYIGQQAFQNCTGLTSVTIPNSVTSIGNDAFAWCPSLTSLTIPNSVTSIGEEAFLSCTGLTSVTIPNSVTSIGRKAFYHCISLTSMTIPNSVTYIGQGAFNDCKGLTSVTIGNSVTNIGNDAFFYCKGLTSVTCFATRPPQLDAGAFDGVDKSTCVLYVPAGSVSAYQSADQWKEFTNILPIGAQPADVTTTTVTPSATTADIAWPQVTGADTYTIEIKKNGELICTPTFNAQGQLISIAFAAPSRNNAPQQAQAAGFSFTVTSLDSGTTYSYTMTAKGNNGNVLKTESGSFTTTGDAQGLEEISSSLQGGDRGRLIYHNGQIYLLRGDKVYTLQGQEVR